MKSLEVKITLEGQGVVQFDSNKLNSAINSSKNTLVKSWNKNVSYAKSYFKKTGTQNDKGEDEISRHLKISADGLRHAIHIQEHPMHTPSIALHEGLKVQYLADLGTLQRGYLITDTGEKRKSCYTITPAKEISGAVPVLEFHSRSGAKESSEGKTEEDGKDTTLFSRDSVGDTQYEATMLIDLSEVGLISLSDIQDRRALLDTLIPLYTKELSSNLGSQVPDPSYFLRKNSAYKIPEKGILLTKEQIEFVVLNLLEKVSNLYISKSQTGYVKVTDVKIRPAPKLGEDTEFVSLSEASTLLKGMEISYEEMPMDEALAILDSYKEEVEAYKKRLADEKRAKKTTK